MTDSLRRQLLDVLFEHDTERLTCYDHEGLCCPAEGCRHDIRDAGPRGHLVDEMLPVVWAAIGSELNKAVEGFADSNRTRLAMTTEEVTLYFHAWARRVEREGPVPDDEWWEV